MSANNCAVHGAWCREDFLDTAPCPWCEIARLKALIGPQHLLCDECESCGIPDGPARLTECGHASCRRCAAIAKEKANRIAEIPGGTVASFVVDAPFVMAKGEDGKIHIRLPTINHEIKALRDLESITRSFMNQNILQTSVVRAIYAIDDARERDKQKSKEDPDPMGKLRSHVIAKVQSWLDDTFAKSEHHVDDMISREITSPSRPIGALTLTVSASGVYRGAIRYESADELPFVGFKEKGFVR